MDLGRRSRHSGGLRVARWSLGLFAFDLIELQAGGWLVGHWKMAWGLRLCCGYTEERNVVFHHFFGRWWGDVKICFRKKKEGRWWMQLSLRSTCQKFILRATLIVATTADGCGAVRVRNLSWLRTSPVKNVPWQTKSFWKPTFLWRKWCEVLGNAWENIDKQTNTFPLPRFRRCHSKTEDSWFVTIAKHVPPTFFLWSD